MFQKFKATIERFFEPPPIHRLMHDQLYEADRLALAHDCTSEYHEALALMYRARADRLRELLGYDVKPLTGNSHLQFSEDLKGFRWGAGK